MNNKTEFNINNCSLSFILKTIKEKGIKEEDYDKFNVILDYGGCYYESDSPGIILIGPKNQEQIDLEKKIQKEYEEKMIRSNKKLVKNKDKKSFLP